MTTRSKPIVEKMSEEQLLQQIENLEKKLAANAKEAKDEINDLSKQV